MASVKLSKQRADGKTNDPLKMQIDASHPLYLTEDEEPILEIEVHRVKAGDHPVTKVDQLRHDVQLDGVVQGDATTC